MIQLGQILFILSVLVILHEFGHYITARMFKVRVEKFYLFMDAGFALLKKKIGDTEWGIGWLPIGGYVKLSGMVDESMDMEQMKQEPQPWEFRSKPAWQRLIIMLGGIIVNILLAWFIYTVVYTTYGQKYVSTEKLQENGLSFGETGINVGFRNGDKILSVDGVHQPRFNRMVLDALLGDNIEIERKGEKKTLVLTDANKAEILGKEEFEKITFNYSTSDLSRGNKIFPHRRVAFRWRDLFPELQEERTSLRIPEGEFLILLTPTANVKNWFAALDENRPFNGFIHTSDWEYFIDCDPALAVAFEVVALILQKNIFKSYFELSQTHDCD